MDAQTHDVQAKSTSKQIRPAIFSQHGGVAGGAVSAWAWAFYILEKRLYPIARGICSHNSVDQFPWLSHVVATYLDALMLRSRFLTPPDWCLMLDA